MLKMRVLPALFGFAVLVAACGGNESTSDDSTRDDQGTIVEGGDVGVFALAVGDCFDDPAAEATEVYSVDAIPCDEPHDNQVVAKFDLASGDFPGEEEVMAQAYQGCLDRFEEVTGEAYETSPLDIFPLFPTEGGWDAGDHEVVCNLYNVNLSKLTEDLIA